MNLNRHCYVLSVLACALLCAMPAVAERRPTPSLIGLAVSLACLPLAAKLDRFMSGIMSEPPEPERPRYERPEDDPNLYVRAVIRRQPAPEPVRPSMTLTLNEPEVLNAVIAYIQQTHGLKIGTISAEVFAFNPEGEHVPDGYVEVRLGILTQSNSVEPAAETLPSA